VRRLALLLLSGSAAACGGDGESERLSRAEYRKLANASCVEAERKLDALGGFADFKELEREMKEGQKAMEQSARELRDLRPPKELMTRHAELVDLTEQTAELAGRLSVAAGENDQVEMQKQNVPRKLSIRKADAQRARSLKGAALRLHSLLAADRSSTRR
jgi:hypothetical protein